MFPLWRARDNCGNCDDFFFMTRIFLLRERPSQELSGRVAQRGTSVKMSRSKTLETERSLYSLLNGPINLSAEKSKPLSCTYCVEPERLVCRGCRPWWPWTGLSKAGFGVQKSHSATKERQRLKERNYVKFIKLNKMERFKLLSKPKDTRTSAYIWNIKMCLVLCCAVDSENTAILRLDSYVEDSVPVQQWSEVFMMWSVQETFDICGLNTDSTEWTTGRWGKVLASEEH